MTEPTDASLTGWLLVSSPVLKDPNFDRTVVLVLEHGPTGAVGLVLNRPSVAPVGMVTPAWEDLCGEPRVVFSGGPVQPDAAICLGRLDGPEDGEGTTQLFGSVASVDLDARPEAVGRSASRIRIFAGYAGWGEAQLDREVEAGGWLVLPRLDADAFSATPQGLWRRVLRRQPRTALSMLASFPDDPEQN